MLIQGSKISYLFGAMVAAGVVVLAERPASANCSAQAQTSSTLVADAHSASSDAVGTIVDVAVENGSFTTLVAALKAAGLVETLQGDGPFTVFAPTDEAFAALPAGTVEELLKPENKEVLTQILMYHVVAAEVPSSAVTPGAATTAANLPVELNVTDGQVTVNDANVIAADVEASNGIVHVIDRVLLPPSN